MGKKTMSALYDTEDKCVEAHHVWSPAHCEQNVVLQKRTGNAVKCEPEPHFAHEKVEIPFPDKKSCLGEKNLVKEVKGKKAGKMVPACTWKKAACYWS